MDKRAFLAVVLSFAVLYIYQAYFMPPLPKPEAVTAPAASEPVKDSSATEKQSATGEPSVSAQPAVQAVVAPPAVQAVVAPPAVKADELVYEGKKMRAVLSGRGMGGLKGLTLAEYFEEMESKTTPVERINVSAGDPLPLSMTFKSPNLNITADTVGEMQRVGETEFLSVYDAGGVRLERRFRFTPDRYKFDMEITVVNGSGEPLSGELSINLCERDTVAGDRYSFIGQAAMVGDGVKKEAFSDIKKDPHHLEGDIKWVLFENKYFMTALMPQGEDKRGVVTSRTGENLMTAAMIFPDISVPAGKDKTIRLTAYSGPKDLSRLREVGAGLEGAIDLGWFHAIAEPLLRFLKVIYSYTGNYGIAIILVTILIKIAFFPLANKSYRSMKEMQKLQPIMTELREKYKDDKEKMSREVMELYRKHRVNPLGGCLPMIVQIPVFIALYNVLLNAIELRHAPFFLWITDMSAKDPYYITPVVMGATMFIQQKLSPAAPDPTQQKVMMMMPIIFTFMFLNFPSGLVIYWLVNNVLSIAQQYYIMKKA